MRVKRDAKEVVYFDRLDPSQVFRFGGNKSEEGGSSDPIGYYMKMEEIRP